MRLACFGSDTTRFLRDNIYYVISKKIKFSIRSVDVRSSRKWTRQSIPHVLTGHCTLTGRYFRPCICVELGVSITVNVLASAWVSCWPEVFCFDRESGFINVVVQFYPWGFKFPFPMFQKHFHILPYTQRERKIKLKPRKKLNPNIYRTGSAKRYLLGLHNSGSDKPENKPEQKIERKRRRSE